MKTFSLVCLLLAAATLAAAQQPARPQAPALPAEAAAEKAFHEGNAFMEQGKHAEALASYKEGLKHLPDDPSLLYNASTAALLVEDFATAAGYLKKLVPTVPEDWQARAKLIQAYQALGDLKARDAERAALLELRKRGGGENRESPEMALSKQEMYCRERFNVAGRKGMAFEHFELKGPRGLRYVFIVFDQASGREAFRISLGSYDTTNTIWAELNKEKAAKGGRLFHLDGYFGGGSHATYGMFHPEPSYDEVRKLVFDILEKKRAPISSSTPARPAQQPPEKKPN
ncbi:MAG TPA: tetratricopeptide repeat protein [Pyrinomonadaceae bacterium]|nr:tetratricopeptide repeat protein [Pyrinomonadaceae bacterium]